MEPLAERDLDTLKDNGYRHELQAGFLLREPPPGFRHGRLQMRLGEALAAFARSRRLGEVVPDVGFVLAEIPATVRQPDLAFVQASRLTSLVDEARRFPGPPDLAVEVLSPGDRPGDVHAKVADFLAAGTRAVWVVDARTRTVTCYRTLLHPRRLGEQDVLEGEDVLPGFSIAVAAIFG
jgi:Uma2 family endonuclease